MAGSIFRQATSAMIKKDQKTQIFKIQTKNSKSCFSYPEFNADHFILFASQNFILHFLGQRVRIYQKSLRILRIYEINLNKIPV